MNAYKTALEIAENIAAAQIDEGRFAQVDEPDFEHFIFWLSADEREESLRGLSVEVHREYPECIRVVRVDETCYPEDDGVTMEAGAFDVREHIGWFIEDVLRVD